jgi:hypothetical protein
LRRDTVPLGEVFGTIQDRDESHDTEQRFGSILEHQYTRWRLVEQQKEANRLIEADCQADPRLVFIDTFPAMLEDDDRPRPGLFGADNMHMDPRGYAIWNSLLKPALK